DLLACIILAHLLGAMAIMIDLPLIQLRCATPEVEEGHTGARVPFLALRRERRRACLLLDDHRFPQPRLADGFRLLTRRHRSTAATSVRSAGSWGRCGAR